LDEKWAWQSGTSKLLFFHLFLDSVISSANSCKMSKLSWPKREANIEPGF
jgi:hypothetical protein